MVAAMDALREAEEGKAGERLGLAVCRIPAMLLPDGPIIRADHDRRFRNSHAASGSVIAATTSSGTKLKATSAKVAPSR